MSKNDRDKIRLLILGIIIIGVGYYKYVYVPQLTAIDEKSKQEIAIIEKYNNVVNTINTFEDKKIEVKILKAKINDKTTPFYPVINKEQIIVELDKLLKDNNLKGGITFQPVVSDSVEASKNEVKSLPDSSLKKIVDQYKNTLMIDGKNEQNKIANENDSNNIDKSIPANNANEPQTSNTQKNPKEKKNTVQYLKCEVRFEGTMENLNKFLNTIGKNEKRIIVNSIKISKDDKEGIKGSINLEFYAVPKINDELENYLKWQLNNEYGKNLLFSNTLLNKNAEENVQSGDFIVSIKSVSSDLPTVMIGKVNDFLRTTYVYGDNNGEENVEIILTQDKDKYFYRYKTSKAMYPANNSGAGVEFVPASKNIVLNVLSEKRTGSNDKSELKLKITNKTDKLVNVDITGEDKIDPRVTVEGDGKNINVNQK